MALFFSSWMFQWAMKYRDSPTFTIERFRKKLTVSLAFTLGIFIVVASMLVIEVYALLGLQFCDGEDLMSLYWATWTTLQLGSEIAILGVSLALWHHLWDMEHPLWALALGTPVLVVAGLGHLLSLVLRQFYHKAKARSRSSKALSAADSVRGPVLSSSTTVEPTQVEDEKHTEQISGLEQGQKMFFAIETGDDERIRRWPIETDLPGGFIALEY
ncbi:hypothetical protein EKO27_g3277 [Xylaria grammica]|uniref:Uncharacterized protein n=1 Tax=Xylaria grammica TaxID=363999 RepID=A0A439DBP1_9PEZI|nr:hypothetical protein EKO27_g3277 [Xylaria grammica]